MYSQVGPVEVACLPFLSLQGKFLVGSASGHECRRLFLNEPFEVPAKSRFFCPSCASPPLQSTEPSVLPKRKDPALPDQKRRDESAGQKVLRVRVHIRTAYFGRKSIALHVTRSLHVIAGHMYLYMYMYSYFQYLTNRECRSGWLIGAENRHSQLPTQTTKLLCSSSLVSGLQWYEGGETSGISNLCKQVPGNV